MIGVSDLTIAFGVQYNTLNWHSRTVDFGDVCAKNIIVANSPLVVGCRSMRRNRHDNSYTALHSVGWEVLHLLVVASA